MSTSADIAFRAPRPPLVPPGGVDLHERDMTATFSVDLTLADVQSRLAAIGQWLPIDGDPSATLAALVNADSTGPLRLGYGAWRDLLLGVQFANGMGELITAGGRTVKNVAGYDLTKFMAGQSGVFGTLITITTRTYQLPAGAVLARHAPDPSLLGPLLATFFRPQWALLEPEALWLGYVGDARTIDYLVEHLPDTRPIELTRRDSSTDMADRARLWRAAGPAVYRASVPPARILEFVQGVRLTSWIADPAFGIVLGSLEAIDAIAPVRAAAEGVGGSVRVRRGSSIGPFLDVSTNVVERQIIERLKRAFDPDEKLTPLPWPTH